MAQLIRDLTRRVDGVWLLDKPALEEFDKRIDAIWNDIQKYHQDLIKKELKSHKEHAIKLWKAENGKEPSKDELKIINSDATKGFNSNHRYNYINQKKLIIKFLKHKTSEVSSFTEAVNDRALAEETPVAFTQTVRSNNFELEVKLEKDGQSISIDTSYHVNERTYNAFLSIDQWREDHKLDEWIYWWSISRQFTPIIIIAFLILMGFCGLLFNSLLHSNTRIDADSQSDVKHEARQLLSGGLHQDEEKRALEIILTLMVGPAPSKSEKVPIDPWLMTFAIIVPLILVIYLLCVIPRSTIGIGQGVKMLERQRSKIATARKFFPGAICIDILLFFVRFYLSGLFIRR